jgi:hypothetical protein
LRHLDHIIEKRADCPVPAMLRRQQAADDRQFLARRIAAHAPGFRKDQR